MRLLSLAALSVGLLAAGISRAQDTRPDSMFLEFVRRQAAELRAHDKPPATLADWKQKRAVLRDRIQQAWGDFPASPCPLQPRLVGRLQRDGYRVEKIVFQTRPGIWMTANAYVPDRPGKLPAVLCVHGHWAGAKQDPVVQSRCLGLAKLGFFVLVVDAFGAGERGLTKALGEYHGEMVAATLLPVGLPLCGLQVYENRRAVDYLLTRPEVDGRRLGVTGASGGGNQTMYAGAWDDRFAAAVPVCSVGNYQAYLGAACCMCEVVPGALQFTEECGVLALTAPRALMIVNATKDGRQFSVAEARKSIAQARPVFALYGHPEFPRHAIFESPHDYNGAMREAMYGWMTRYLKGLGDGAAIREPSFKTEDREMLRCFPGSSRPDDFKTIPQFAAGEARKLLAQKPLPNNVEQWRAQRAAMLEGLNKVLHRGNCPMPAGKALISVARGKGDSHPSQEVAVTSSGTSRTITFHPEPGLTLVARQEPAVPSCNKLALVLDLDGAEQASRSPLTAALRGDGWSVLTVDLRATGKLAEPHDTIGRAPDHNTAEWSLWLGRPLLGQWTIDVRRLLDAVKENNGKLPEQILAAGIGPAGLVAICSAALDRRITQVATAGTLASYVTDEPYQGQRLGIMAPGILREVGDVGHLAALVAPRKCVIAGGVNGAGKPLDDDALQNAFAVPRKAYAIEGAAHALRILPAADAREIIKALGSKGTASAGGLAVGLRAGFAERDITPALGMEVPGGYTKAFCRAIHDPCKVRAAVFDNGRTRIALVSIDGGFIFRPTVEKARAEIQRRSGIPPRAVLIGATHSHSSGPLGIVQPGEYDHASPLVRTLAYEKSACADAKYLDLVQNQIVAAVCEADNCRVPVRAGVGKGIEDKVSFNRRLRMKNGQTFTHPGQGNPAIVDYAGPIDPEVGVLGAWDRTGKLRGCVVNFACHATTSPPGISANYIYYLERAIRGFFGSDVIVLFLPGDSGDVTQVDNRSPYANPDGDRWAQIVGGRLGAEAVRVLLKMEPGDLLPLDARSRLLEIERRVPRRERVERAYTIVGKNPPQVDPTEWAFAKEIVLLDALLQKSRSAEVEVQAIQIGPAVFLASPGELFCQYELEQKAKSPFPMTFCVSVANGFNGYVPTREAFAKTGGGYETRLTSCSNLEVGAGAKIVEAALELARQMKPGSLPEPPKAPPFRQPWSYGSVPAELD